MKSVKKFTRKRPKQKMIVFYIDEELARKFKKLMKINDWTMTSFLEVSIENIVDEYEREKKEKL